MRCFTDTAQKRWTVSITAYSIKKCRGLLNVDLYGLVAGGMESLSKLLGDPVMLVDTLYVLCDVDKTETTDEEFGRAFSGDVLTEATRAFLEELTDFFPEPQRTGLKKIMEKTRELEGLVEQHQITMLAQIDPRALLEEQIAKTKKKGQALLEETQETDLASFSVGNGNGNGKTGDATQSEKSGSSLEFSASTLDHSPSEN